ncbi:MAG: hypothetical protein LBV72_13485 [Tannerella sp.]|jgi:hypothetical protein|nr:hypothetical protein [Tannerella sp.]
MDIWGKAITEGIDSDSEPFRSEFDLFSNLIEWGYQVNPPDYRDKLQQLDAGTLIGFDLMWDKWALRSAYKWGLINRNFLGYQLKSQTLSVSLAYYFK